MVALPLAASVGSISADAHAATCTSIDCTGTIKHISVFEAGHSLGAIVRLDTDNGPTGTNCSLSGGSWQVAPGDENVIRALLSAHLAGRKVTLREVTNTGICQVDYVSIW
jgi:hypothetical protein